MAINASFHQYTRWRRSGRVRSTTDIGRSGYVPLRSRTGRDRPDGAGPGRVDDERRDDADHVEGHAGEQAVAAIRGFDVDVMFTLNGGHIWPLYEACRNQGVRVVDVRHEQSATFAAEAYAKLTRKPGIAALTAGPGHHQRGVGGDVGVVQRLAARRARRAGAAGAVGVRVAAGARPRADPGLDHEVGGDGPRSGQGRA